MVGRYFYLLLLKGDTLLLEFGVYRYRLRVMERLRLPWFLGNGLRGAFGRSFRRIVCTVLRRKCEECVLQGECPYSVVFSPVLPKETERLRGMRDIPRPFVMRSKFEPGRVLEEGDEFSFEMVVVGEARRYTPYFLVVVQDLAAGGIGGRDMRGRMRLDKVEVYDKEGDCWKEIFNCKDGLLDMKVVGFEWKDFVRRDSNGKARRVKIEFLTPTRIVENGEVKKEKISFSDIVRRLRDRLNMLSVFYCGGEMGLDYKGLGERAAGVRDIDGKLEWVEQIRYMRRKGRWHPMGGVVGQMEFEGEVGEFMPLLRCGEWLHLGKFAPWGYGQIRVEVIK